MEFRRLQDKLTAGQFVARRHYCITDKVFDYVEDEQLKLKKKDRKNCPTKADMYYQLLISGLEHADKVTFQNLPELHKVRIKIGKPINEQLLDIQARIVAGKLKAQLRHYSNESERTITIFSVAVCLMECAIDNQK